MYISVWLHYQAPRAIHDAAYPVPDLGRYTGAASPITVQADLPDTPFTAGNRIPSPHLLRWLRFIAGRIHEFVSLMSALNAEPRSVRTSMAALVVR